MSGLLNTISTVLPELRAIAEELFLLTAQVVGYYVILRYLWTHRK